MSFCFNNKMLDLTHLTVKTFIKLFSNKYIIEELTMIKEAKCSINKYLVSDKYNNNRPFSFYKIFYKKNKEYLQRNDARHPYGMLKNKYISSITEFKDYLKNPEKYIYKHYINQLQLLSNKINIHFSNKKKIIIIIRPKIFKIKVDKEIYRKLLSLLMKKYKKISRKNIKSEIYDYLDIYHININNRNFYKI